MVRNLLKSSSGAAVFKMISMPRFFGLVLLIAFVMTSSATAQTQYAYLSELERTASGWRVQADYVDLVSPKVAVSRGAIAASDARHYKAVLSNRNDQRRGLTMSSVANVQLLTFPNFALKTARLETLMQMLSDSQDLPSEFESGKLFALRFKGSSVIGLQQVDTRAVTGVYDQGVLISKKTVFSSRKFVLDFVDVYTSEREAQRDGKTGIDMPSGLYISNKNPALRNFVFSSSGRIKLLKSAGETFSATLKQLEAGLNGQDFGWRFDWENYFYAKISDVTGEILELRQGYVP
jgi:hypothetical protein